MTAEERRERNRRDFPEWTKIVDEFRRAFGDDVKVKWVREGEKTLGRPDA